MSGPSSRDPRANPPATSSRGHSEVGSGAGVVYVGETTRGPAGPHVDGKGLPVLPAASRPDQARIDLHCHSVFSDGTLSPEVLVEQAARAGLSALAITDHDTVEGLARAREAASRVGLRLIPGIEISADCDGIGVHILGYFVDPDNAVLLTALHRAAQARCRRVEGMVGRLRDLGLSLSVEDVTREGAEGTWGRPHVARALVRRELVGSFDEAFRRYLGNNGPAWMPRDEVSAGDAIALIHLAGGVAILAHPFSYRLGDESRGRRIGPLLDALIDARLDGIEVAYSSCSTQDTKLLIKEANCRNLAVSGGSDYHGASTPGVRLGVGRGNLRVPLDWLAMLEIRRGGAGPRPTRAAARA